MSTISGLLKSTIVSAMIDLPYYKITLPDSSTNSGFYL